MHTQMNAVFNSFYAGINTYHLSVAYRHEKLKTNFGWGLTYFDYGKIAETDPSGNMLGSVYPTDWVMQVSASRSYLEKWNYGASFKFISSNYGVYSSNGIAMDVGVSYTDTANLFFSINCCKEYGLPIKEICGNGG